MNVSLIAAIPAAATGTCSCYCYILEGTFMSPKRKGHFRGENKRVRVVKECTRSTGYPTGTFFCIYLLLYLFVSSFKGPPVMIKNPSIF